MRGEHGGAVLRSMLALLLVLCLEPSGGQPIQCDPSCSKWGNCNLETGKCQCRWGRLGNSCEVDALPACRLTPEHPPYCGQAAARSCTCMDQCSKYLCKPNKSGSVECDRTLARTHGCFERAGGPEEQTSMPPEEGESGVKYHMWQWPGNRSDATEEEAMNHGKQKTLPLSRCPNKCSMAGSCMAWNDQPTLTPGCLCHRGFAGPDCSEEVSACVNNCNGRGKCINSFCHCEPPYFSLGCSRSKAYPPGQAMPSPTQFKVYMYELPTWLAFDQEIRVGWSSHDPIYTAYNLFLARFLNSTVRTEDPYEANLFLIPAFTYGYTSNGGSPENHFWHVANYLEQNFPFWNRTQGRDHIIWTPGDRGACQLTERMHSVIKLTHFGLYSTHTPTLFGGMHPDWGCFNPLRDVAPPPYFDKGGKWGRESAAAPTPLDKKERTLFFAGGIGMEYPNYSGNTRQLLLRATEAWNDSAYVVTAGGVPDYLAKFRGSKFCLAPYGHGWGIRLVQVMVSDCVPLIIQDHVFQFLEDVLPYEDFSIRLSNADIPHLREILGNVTDAQYAKLIAGVHKYWPAFVWEGEAGGKAFEYTILSLKRKWMHLKASYFLPTDEAYYKILA